MQSRREFLLGLAASVPLASVLQTLPAQAKTKSDLLKVSEVITGRNDLDPGIADRVRTLLSKRIDKFDAAVSAMAKSFDWAADRDAALNALDDKGTKLALAIAQPWYVGYVGKPATLKARKDDAEFVTYLQANAYDLIIDVVPRPAYSRGGQGWWADTPHGVTAPAMPDGIKEWRFQPDNLAKTIADADPAYLLMVKGEAKSLDEAHQKLANKSAQPKGDK